MSEQAKTEPTPYARARDMIYDTFGGPGVVTYVDPSCVLQFAKDVESLIENLVCYGDHKEGCRQRPKPLPMSMPVVGTAEIHRALAGCTCGYSDVLQALGVPRERLLELLSLDLPAVFTPSMKRSRR